MAVPAQSTNGVLVADDDGLEFRFTCGQWSLLSDDDKALWTVLENSCGQPETLYYPFAYSRLQFTLGGKIKARIPLRILSLTDGVKQVEFYKQPAGWALQGPVSGPDDYPQFRPLPAAISFEDFFALLPTFPDDDAAIAAGLLPGNLYWLRYDTDIGLKDSLKRVSGAADPGDLSLLEIYLNDLPAYADNDAALADGAVSGNLYWLSPDTEVGLKDTFMRVSP